MTATITNNETSWKLPDLDTVYQCEGMGPMTLAQMLDGVDPDLIPSDQVMYEDLLRAYGARGGHGSGAGPGCGDGCWGFCRRRCAQATQAHSTQAAAPWVRLAVGRAQGGKATRAAGGQ